MSTPFTRGYNWVNDKNASVPITASRQDEELDNITTKLNQKVVIKSTAPSSPIADMIWMDSSVSPAQPKIYTGSAWTDLESIKGADIASATTTDIGAATGRFVDITGTTTITGLGTVRAGTIRFVRFTGALTLTHNATSLILPSATNITTVAGDTACFVSLGSGNWRCLYYQRASGAALVAPTVATQAQMETATDTTAPVTAGRTQYHPGVAKAWCVFDGTGTPAHAATHNVDSSITDNGTGDYTVALTTDMSGTDYVLVGIAKAGRVSINATGGLAAGTARILVYDVNASGVADSAQVCLAFFGDQA